MNMENINIGKNKEILSADSVRFFPEVLTAEKDERLYAESLPALQESFARYTREKLADFSEAHDGKNDQRRLIEDDLYLSYEKLRSANFSHAEVAELSYAARGGSFEKVFVEQLLAEQKEIERRREASKERIVEVEKCINDYFSTMGAAYPENRDAVAGFFGKYQSLVIGFAIARHDRVCGEPFSPLGWFPVSENAVLVRVNGEKKETDGQAFSDAEIHIYAHERLHALSGAYGQAADELPAFAQDRLKKARLGFARKYSHDKAYRFGGLNEAVTECAALDVSGAMGHRGFPVAYKSFISSLEIFTEFLATRKGSSFAEEKARFFQRYCQRNGLAELNRELEREIGPYGIHLINAFFQKPDLLERFLELLDKERARGRGEDERMSMNADFFEYAQLPVSLSDVVRIYPFLKIMIRRLNRETREWEEVELPSHPDQKYK